MKLFERLYREKIKQAIMEAYVAGHKNGVDFGRFLERQAATGNGCIIAGDIDIAKQVNEIVRKAGF